MIQVKPRRPRARLSAERRTLAERYVPLAIALARPLQQRWPRLSDELESAANLALVEAAEAFDPAHRVRFATFARRRIVGALRDVQRQTTLRGWRGRHRADQVPVLEPLPATPDEEIRKFRHCRQKPVGHDLEVVEEVESWLRRLPRHYAEACREIYLEGRTITETARTLGYSHVNAQNLHRKALAMLMDEVDDPWHASCDPSDED